MHCCIAAPTTDNNMIRVILNMGESAANRQGVVGEFHFVWSVVTLDILFISPQIRPYTPTLRAL